MITPEQNQEMLFPRRTSIEEFKRRNRKIFDSKIEKTVREIVDRVRDHGESALRRYAEKYDGLGPGSDLYLSRTRLREAFASLPENDRKRLVRIAGQIRSFAEAQRVCQTDLDVAIPGGRAGHRVTAVERAGCYAPGGRYPLPSSVLMTVIPAHVAGVREIWVASPDVSPITMAAAWLAGANGLVAAGGAHAIAALAYGAGPVPPVDVIVGPGNRYVTAAKKYLSGEVRIDMLAGPSELVIIADDSANAETVASDLLAQAEHDEDAFPVLISLDPTLTEDVKVEMNRQLTDLPSAATALKALSSGGSLQARNLTRAVAWCDALAPEHVQLCIKDAAGLAGRLSNFGSVFIGELSAEVFADYGAGPNHVLPTNGNARTTGGLSVFTFLRIQTWTKMDLSDNLDRLIEDSAWFARQEGLEAHARAAEKRRRNL